MNVAARFMEISKLGDTGLKIKTKNITVVVDPAAKAEADVIIHLDRMVPLNAKDIQGAKLTIDGPGEFEIAGLSITGEKVGQDVMYRLDDEAFGLILATSRIVATAKEEEGEQALVVEAAAPVQADLLDSYVQDVCVVFGASANLPQAADIKKEPKVNLRKLEDLKGAVVVLAKE